MDNQGRVTQDEYHAALDRRDPRSSAETRAKKARPLNEQALGAMSNGLTDGTAKPGVLNPVFPCWLMGYPETWLEASPDSVTQSSRPSRLNS